MEVLKANSNAQRCVALRAKVNCELVAPPAFSAQLVANKITLVILFL